MKDLYKPTLVCLSSRQDKNLEQTIEYLVDAADTLDELEKTKRRARNFVDELESFSFISPNERHYYMGYIENKTEAREEFLRKKLEKKEEKT